MAEQPTDIPVQFNDELTSPGTWPIVILGPNGSGKTRFGRNLSNRNGGDFIAALRNIELAVNIPLQTVVDATNNLRSTLSNTQSQPWLLSNEINSLFSKLMAADSAGAVKFRDDFFRDPKAKPEETTLMRLGGLWSQVFPGRELTFAGYAPTVTSKLEENTSSYAAQQMSDGERVGLYLAARVLDSNSQIIIVDEPEVHFHSRLAARFWDELQNLRPDCRFIYITHDLGFALSRGAKEFIVVRSRDKFEVVSLKNGFPTDLSESILAAATISIYAKRIIFSEGEESGNDQQFFSAWFNDKNTAVVPVGSCRDVLRCTTTFRDQGLVTGAKSEGIIDSDYWPSEFLGKLPEGVTALPLHEIESLFCLPDVFRAVAEHCGRSREEIDKAYSEFLADARSRFQGALFAKQVSERFRCRCEQQVRSAMNGLHVHVDLEVTRRDHCDAVSADKWTVKPDAVFESERATLEKALAGPPEEFLQYFPGKTVLSGLANKLGMTSETYSRLIFDGLRATDKSPLRKLGIALETTLADLLPKRLV